MLIPRRVDWNNQTGKAIYFRNFMGVMAIAPFIIGRGPDCYTSTFPKWRGDRRPKLRAGNKRIFIIIQLHLLTNCAAVHMIFCLKRLTLTQHAAVSWSLLRRTSPSGGLSSSSSHFTSTSAWWRQGVLCTHRKTAALWKVVFCFLLRTNLKSWRSATEMMQ